MLPGSSPQRRSPRVRGPADPFASRIGEFLTYLRVEAGAAPATLEAYGRDLGDLREFLRGRLDGLEAIRPAHLADHMRYLHRERGLQSASIARHLATIRVFFRFLAANGVLDDNPTRLLETPTRWKRLPGVLSPRQMQKLLAEIGRAHV